MSNVYPLRISDLTPSMVLEAVKDRQDDLVDVYVVGIDKAGQPVMYASGDLSGLALAALSLQQLAVMNMNGEIIQE